MQKRFAGLYRSVWGLAALLPAVFFAIMIWQRRWTADDGFINIRIVANLLAGDGPVFNAGERVEAYTSTLWMGVIALLGWLGIGLEEGAMWAALGFSVLGVVLAQLGAITLAGEFSGAAGGEEKQDVDVKTSLWRRMWAHKMLPVGAV